MNEIYAAVFQKNLWVRCQTTTKIQKINGKIKGTILERNHRYGIDGMISLWYAFSLSKLNLRVYIILFIYLQYVEIRGWAQSVRIEASKRLSKNQKQKLNLNYWEYQLRIAQFWKMSSIMKASCIFALLFNQLKKKKKKKKEKKRIYLKFFVGNI